MPGCEEVSLESINSYMVQAILGESQGAALTPYQGGSLGETASVVNQMWEEGPAPTHSLTGVGPPAGRALLSGSLHSEHFKRAISV